MGQCVQFNQLPLQPPIRLHQLCGQGLFFALELRFCQCLLHDCMYGKTKA
jgi:hypothetical protein